MQKKGKAIDFILHFILTLTNQYKHIYLSKFKYIFNLLINSIAIFDFIGIIFLCHLIHED